MCIRDRFYRGRGRYPIFVCNITPTIRVWSCVGLDWKRGDRCCRYSGWFMGVERGPESRTYKFVIPSCRTQVINNWPKINNRSGVILYWPYSTFYLLGWLFSPRYRKSDRVWIHTMGLSRTGRSSWNYLMGKISRQNRSKYFFSSSFSHTSKFGYITPYLN